MGAVFYLGAGWPQWKPLGIPGTLLPLKRGSWLTCMAVRAIHLELVMSLSVEALTQALQRFMNRRGVPQLCISDHGSNFVAAAKWVKEKNLEMKWQFVVERGPW